MAFGGVKGALAALGGSAALDAAFKPSLVANIGAAHAARLDPWNTAGVGRTAHGEEDPRSFYVAWLRPRPTFLVRGSSRRITTMTAGLALDPRISE